MFAEMAKQSHAKFSWSFQQDFRTLEAKGHFDLQPTLPER